MKELLIRKQCADQPLRINLRPYLRHAFADRRGAPHGVVRAVVARLPRGLNLGEYHMRDSVLEQFTTGPVADAPGAELVGERLDLAGGHPQPARCLLYTSPSP